MFSRASVVVGLLAFALVPLIASIVGSEHNPIHKLVDAMTSMTLQGRTKVCSPCAAGSFRATAPTASTCPPCIACTTCSAGRYQVSDCSATADRTCASCEGSTLSAACDGISSIATTACSGFRWESSWESSQAHCTRCGLFCESCPNEQSCTSGMPRAGCQWDPLAGCQSPPPLPCDSCCPTPDPCDSCCSPCDSCCPIPDVCSITHLLTDPTLLISGSNPVPHGGFYVVTCDFGYVSETPFSTVSGVCVNGALIQPLSISCVSPTSSCIEASSSVLMADGTSKPARDLLVGDKVAVSVPAGDGSFSVGSADLVYAHATYTHSRQLFGIDSFPAFFTADNWLINADNAYEPLVISPASDNLRRPASLYKARSLEKGSHVLEYSSTTGNLLSRRVEEVLASVVPGDTIVLELIANPPRGLIVNGLATGHDWFDWERFPAQTYVGERCRRIVRETVDSRWDAIPRTISRMQYNQEIDKAFFAVVKDWMDSRSWPAPTATSAEWIDQARAYSLDFFANGGNRAMVYASELQPYDPNAPIRMRTVGRVIQPLLEPFNWVPLNDALPLVDALQSVVQAWWDTSAF